MLFDHHKQQQHQPHYSMGLQKKMYRCRVRGACALSLFPLLSFVATLSPFHWTSAWMMIPLSTTTKKARPCGRSTSLVLSSSSSSTSTDGASSSSSFTNNNNNNIPIWTQAQLEDYANRQGVVLSLTTLGPAYRVVARAKHNATLILGYVEGFTRPTGHLLHLDKMEVFRKMVQRTRAENPNEFKGGGTSLGVGLLMGYLCLLHGQTKNCRHAEFLAIDDEDRQHKRLVRYYRSAGFDFIKYVGDDFKDIPDRMVWGGCGTLLRKDIPSLLAFWTKLMQKSLENKN